MNTIEYFKNNKYVILRDFFNKKDTKRMANRMHHLKKLRLLTTDPQCPLSDSIYSDPVHSEMQEIYKKSLEEHIGIELFPTYTYARIYQPKEVLKLHSDRPSCEISITGTLDFDTFDDKPWSIYVESNNPTDMLCEIESEENKKTVLIRGKEIILYPGDVLAYRGCDILHWRHKFIGVSQTQVFMHYVNKYGKYHEYKYDFRQSLGSSVKTKDVERERICNENFDQKRTI